MNHNVLLAFLLRVTLGISMGIWASSTLSNYINILGGGGTHSSELVGFAQAIEGTMMALVALPLGWFAGHLRRDTIMKCGGIFGLVAVGVMAAAIHLHHHKYLLICISVGLIGVTEASSPILESLLADSTPTGQRSQLYTMMFIASILSQGLGPGIAAAVAFLYGNVWELGMLERVMLVGMAVMLLPVGIMFFFDDDRTLGAESEGLLAHPTPTTACNTPATHSAATMTPVDAPAVVVVAGDDTTTRLATSAGQVATRTSVAPAGEGYQPPTLPSDGSEAPAAVAVAAGGGDSLPVSHSALEPTGSRRVGSLVAEGAEGEAAPLLNKSDTGISGGVAESAADGPVACGCLTRASIPGLLAFSDCIMGLASGMTIKFFPNFFKDEVGLSPVGVGLLYCSLPIAMTLASLYAQRLSHCFGRVQTQLVNKIVGIALLYWMWLHPAIWLLPPIIVPVYIIRTALMNCNYALQKSILMDYVPKATRARWNSLESVTMFGWSGSAAVGGYLLKWYGYGASFSITAHMQLFGMMMLVPLLWLVPVRESAVAGEGAEGEAGGKAGGPGARGPRPQGDLEEPLLGGAPQDGAVGEGGSANCARGAQEREDGAR